MKTFRTVLIALLLAHVLIPVVAPADESSETPQQQVERVIRTAYLEGVFVARDPDLVRAGFHPEFVMHVKTEEGVIRAPLEMWLERMQLDRVRASENFRLEVLQIAVQGDAASAMVRVHEDGEVLYTDLFGLYKFADGWMIVNKIFHSH